jgi:hypothetical protein
VSCDCMSLPRIDPNGYSDDSNQRLQADGKPLHLERSFAVQAPIDAFVITVTTALLWRWLTDPSGGYWRMANIAC